MKYVKDFTTVNVLGKNKDIKDRVVVKIDYTNIKHKYDFTDFSPFIFFLSSNYNNVNDKKDPQKWDKMIRPVNILLEKYISEDNQYEILKTFDKIIKLSNIEFETINNEFVVSRLINLMKNIGVLLHELEKKICLCDSIQKYITHNIYIGDFSQAGNNPQDRMEVTYNEFEASELIMIAILSKLLFPIFGHLIVHIKSHIDKAKEIKNKYPDKIKLDIEDLRLKKEVYISIILDNILINRFSAANRKLDIYISDYVNRQYNDLDILPKLEKENSDTDALAKEYTSGTFFSGITTTNLIMFTKANLLIKALVNGNIGDNNKSNIMAYVHYSVYEMISKKLNERSKHPIFRRIDTSRSDKEVPQFEIDSITSESSLDILGMIDNEVEIVTKSIVSSLEMEHLYEKMIAYHTYKGVVPTYINKLALCTFFGPKIGGGHGILYLNSNRYIELLSTLQLFLLDIKFYDLLHALSASPVGEKREPKQQDIIILNRHKTAEYKRAAITFKHVENLFKQSVDNFINTFITTDFIYNTPDCLYDHLDVPNINGNDLMYSLGTVNQMLILMNLDNKNN